MGRANKALMTSEADRLQLCSMVRLAEHAAFVGAVRCKLRVRAKGQVSENSVGNFEHKDRSGARPSAPVQAATIRT